MRCHAPLIQLIEALEKVEKEFHQHQPALISVILRNQPHLVNSVNVALQRILYSHEVTLLRVFRQMIPVFISTLGEVQELA